MTEWSFDFDVVTYLITTSEIHHLSTILVDVFPKRVCYALDDRKGQSLRES